MPPIPNELMMELPNCHNNWPVCAGRIDWTTFVDFTNMAAAGLEIGYETVLSVSVSDPCQVSDVNCKIMIHQAT